MNEARELANQLQLQIAGGLPGEKAHARMLPEGRKLTSSSLYKESAVLLLLYPKSGQWCMVFIKRNTYDGPHSGQISLPGGKKDESDKDLYQTALREALEETGVDAGDAFFAGELSTLHIPVSGFIVHPYIAVLDRTPVFKPDENEVEYIIEVPVKKLADPTSLKTKKMILFNMEVMVPYFDIEEEVLWGATAMILSEFIELHPEAISD